MAVKIKVHSVSSLLSDPVLHSEDKYDLNQVHNTLTSLGTNKEPIDLKSTTTEPLHEASIFILILI